MKLKKIASLALAGIMAVSMLAGCNNGSNNNGGSSSEVTVTTGIVAAANEGQAKSNEVKVTFTASSFLDDCLESAVKENAAFTTGSALATKVASHSGNSTSTTFYDDDSNDAKDVGGTDTNAEKINAQTKLSGYVANTAWTEELAVKQAVEEINKEISALKADSLTKSEKDALKNDDKYYTYAYTGNVSMTSEVNANGTTTYYFVWTITQEVTQVKYKA